MEVEVVEVEEMSEATYRVRWTTPVDIVVTAVGTDEETAYDVAVARVKERLEQVAVVLSGVAIHGDIDGMEADSVERLGGPEA